MMIFRSKEQMYKIWCSSDCYLCHQYYNKNSEVDCWLRHSTIQQYCLDGYVTSFSHIMMS